MLPPRNKASRLAELLCLLLVSSTACNAQGEYAVLFTGEEGERHKICAMYYPLFKELPPFPSTLGNVQLVNLLAQDGCNKMHFLKMKGKLVMVTRRSTCTFDRVIQNVKFIDPLGILISTGYSAVAHETFENKTKENSNIIVAFVLSSTVRRILSAGKPHEPLLVSMYTEKAGLVDVSVILTWCLAVFTVAAGAYWSGIVKYRLHQQEEARRKRTVKEIYKRAKQDLSYVSGLSGSSVNVTVSIVFVFVLLMVIVIMVLYFFISYLMYLMFAAFFIGSFMSIMAIVEPIIYRIPIGTARLPRSLCCCFYKEIEVRQAFVIAVALFVPGFWVVYRHHPDAWILQNILGAMFCINIMKLLRMPNLKKGDSVMVQVASGGSHPEEKPPVTVKIPFMSTGALSVCLRGASFLGFGDILVPGILVSYCHGFDRLFAGGYYYYFVATMGYGIGLVTAFVALELMATAQPALIYLIPATLIPTFCQAWYRGHLRELWHGVPISSPTSSESEADSDNVEPNRSPQDSSRKGSPREEALPRSRSNSPATSFPISNSPSRRTSAQAFCALGPDFVVEESRSTKRNTPRRHLSVGQGDDCAAKRKPPQRKLQRLSGYYDNNQKPEGMTTF
ncbi:signal peptide peptidase-like 2A isoform X2 [Ornithodoros turicata]|uniref:signal peptide peptidase-like 2A isoform X2 n=1 Tax=Ornithodoros turicata TaxID=34597 RepID=UPI003139B426